MVYLLAVVAGAAEQHGADPDPAAMVRAALGVQPQPM
jgi:hypothetical protein